MPHAATAPQLYSLWKSAVDLNNIKVPNMCQFYVLTLGINSLYKNPKVNQFACSVHLTLYQLQNFRRNFGKEFADNVVKNKTEIIWLLLVYFKV